MWWNKTAVSVKVPDDNWDKPVPKESKDFRDSTTSRTSMLRIPVNVRATTVHSSPPLRSAAASSLSSFSPPTLSVMPTSGTTTSEAALVRKNVDSQSLQSLQSLQTRVSTLEARLSDLSITLLYVCLKACIHLEILFVVNSERCRISFFARQTTNQKRTKSITNWKGDAMTS